MSETRKDYIASLIFFLIGMGVLVSAQLIKDPGLSEMGPREFPRFIGICMVLLSGVLFLKTRKQQADSPEKAAGSPEELGEDRKNELRALALAAICLLYAVLFTTLGYFISTFAAITFTCLLFREKRIWVYPLLYAVSVVIWLGFTYLLAIRLP